MANMLALEAASESCSVTLQTLDFSETLIIDEARSHSKHFLPLVQQLLDKRGALLTDLEFLACGNGPGSFTGLRICFGIAQGLAFGLGIPLLTVSSLESMAHSYIKTADYTPERVVSVLDARMGELYIGEFDSSASKLRLVGELQLLGVAEADAKLSELIAGSDYHYSLVGPGTLLLNIDSQRTRQPVICPQIEPQSSSVAEIALQRWLSGDVTTAADAEIYYLRNTVSWDKRKRIRGSSSEAD